MEEFTQAAITEFHTRWFLTSQIYLSIVLENKIFDMKVWGLEDLSSWFICN